MSDLIAKTLISLNIIRPSNKIILYDDGKYACLLYKSVQTGGGDGKHNINLRFPRWESLELVPKSNYGYDKNKFYKSIDQTGLLSIGIDGIKKELIFGPHDISQYPQAGGMRKNLHKLQKSLKNINFNKITLTNSEDLDQIIMYAQRFTDDVVCTMDNVYGLGQTGGGYSSEPISPTSDFNDTDTSIKKMIDLIINPKPQKYTTYTVNSDSE